jgi:PAS domain S-box-containing protein
MQVQSGNGNGGAVGSEEYPNRGAGYTPLMIWGSGPYQFCTFFNRKWLRFAGGPSLTEVHQGWSGEVHPDDLARCVRSHQRAFIRRSEFRLEYRVRDLHGGYRWILDQGMPSFGPDGKFAGYMGSCVDITKQKELEEELEVSEDELRTSERRYRAVVEDQTELICRFLPDGTFTFVNDAYCRYFGLTQDELMGRNVWSQISAEQQEKARELLASLTAENPVATIEYQVVSNGAIRWHQWTDRGFFDAAGCVIEFQAVGRDITVRKNHEQALRESELKFRSIFDLNIVPLLYWHADGLVEDCNDAYLRLVGCSREELNSGKVRWDRMTPVEDRHLDQEALEELRNGRQFVTPFEKHYCRKDGTRVPVLIGAAVFPGFQDRGVAFAVDLSGQKRLQLELREEKALNAAIIASLSGHVAVIDRAGRIIAVNESWIQFAAEGAGAKDRVDIGADYLEVCSKALRCGDDTVTKAVAGIRSVLTGGKTEFAMQCQCESTPLQWFEIRVEQLRRPEGGAVISHIDVTNRVRAEFEAQSHRRELAHVARVTLLGELTASIAHELNQPLTAILSNAQAGQRILSKKKSRFPIVRDILSDIADDSRRAGEVIHRLRSLLEKGEPQKQSLDVNSLVEQTLRLVHSEMIIRRIAVEKHLDTAVLAVLGDRIQLQQVLLNLIVNAAEAMGECVPTERKVVVSTFATDGRVGIRVRDFGTGLDPKYREQIFEPFFTTKDHGMGVGLWINRAIIESHMGELLAANNDDKGCTFDVMLPAHRRKMS